MLKCYQLHYVYISPLVALMLDQKNKFTEIGISAEFISETHCDIERAQGIKEGTSQLIFMSSELLLHVIALTAAASKSTYDKVY